MLEPFLCLLHSSVVIGSRVLAMKSVKIITCFLILCFGMSFFLGFTPLLLSLFVLIISLLCYFYYAKDKKAAMTGSWRVPENTLHLLALLGGWPGALYAQQRLRHKTQKTSFRVVFFLSVLANCSGVVLLHSHDGQKLLRVAMNSVDSALIRYVDSDRARLPLLFITRLRTR